MRDLKKLSHSYLKQPLDSQCYESGSGSGSGRARGGAIYFYEWDVFCYAPDSNYADDADFRKNPHGELWKNL